MHVKRLPSKLTLIMMGVICLSFVGFRLLSPPKSRTDEAAAPISPFYSPIIPIGDPEFTVSKTISDENPEPGDIVEYTITYANSVSGSRAYNVRLYDFLPAGVSLVGTDRPWSSYENRVLRFDLPDAATTDPVQVTIQAQVTGQYEPLYNRALIVADGVIPATTSLLTEVTPTWLPLKLTGYTVVLTNTELVYEATVKNSSDWAVAKGVKLVDVLPNGLPLNDTSALPDQVSEPLITWSLGDLETNGSRTVVISSTSPSSTGLITSTALVDARQRVVTQTTFATLVIDRGAILRVDKKGSASRVHLGDELVYTLRYENAGNETAASVTLTDTFPTAISVTSVSTPAQSLTDQQGIWALGTLSPGVQGQIVITVTVQGWAGRVLLNKVAITGQPPGTGLWSVYPGYDELETIVSPSALYFPVVLRRY